MNSLRGAVLFDIDAAITGGSTRAELEDAGAAAVYEDVAELLDRLDESPLGRLVT